MNASDDDDKKAVALLDTQYQAARREKRRGHHGNRILPDDFILVVGQRQDLRESRFAERSSRPGAFSTKHQSDSEQNRSHSGATRQS